MPARLWRHLTIKTLFAASPVRLAVPGGLLGVARVGVSLLRSCGLTSSSSLRPLRSVRLSSLSSALRPSVAFGSPSFTSISTLHFFVFSFSLHFQFLLFIFTFSLFVSSLSSPLSLFNFYSSSSLFHSSFLLFRFLQRFAVSARSVVLVFLADQGRGSRKVEHAARPR